MATPNTSNAPNRSPKRIAAMATPKNGLRKWNVAARVAPMRATNENQIKVASRPGARVVYAKAITNSGVRFTRTVSVKPEITAKTAAPTSICHPTTIIKFPPEEAVRIDNVAMERLTTTGFDGDQSDVDALLRRLDPAKGPARAPSGRPA